MACAGRAVTVSSIASTSHAFLPAPPPLHRLDTSATSFQNRFSSSLARKLKSRRLEREGSSELATLSGTEDGDKLEVRQNEWPEKLDISESLLSKMSPEWLQTGKTISGAEKAKRGTGETVGELRDRKLQHLTRMRESTIGSLRGQIARLKDDLKKKEGKDPIWRAWKKLEDHERSGHLYFYAMAHAKETGYPQVYDNTKQVYLLARPQSEVAKQWYAELGWKLGKKVRDLHEAEMFKRAEVQQNWRLWDEEVRRISSEFEVVGAAVKREKRATLSSVRKGPLPPWISLSQESKKRQVIEYADMYPDEFSCPTRKEETNEQRRETLEKWYRDKGVMMYELAEKVHLRESIIRLKSIVEYQKNPFGAMNKNNNQKDKPKHVPNAEEQLQKLEALVLEGTDDQGTVAA